MPLASEFRTYEIGDPPAVFRHDEIPTRNLYVIAAARPGSGLCTYKIGKQKDWCRIGSCRRGVDTTGWRLAYNTDLREALYRQTVAEQATATQKVLGAVGGAVLAVGDFGRETVDSTVSLARNFIAAGTYQWGIADRLGVREQSGIYHDQLGESVAALVGLASVEGVGKVWNHYSGQYSQAATLWKRGDADSIIAASRTATKASLEVGSIATGAYGAIKLTVSGLRMAGTFAQGERAMLATMEGAAYGSWRAQLGAVGDLKGVKPFGATQANDMIRADVAATGRIEVVADNVALASRRVEISNGYSYQFDEAGRIDLIEADLVRNPSQGRNAVAQRNAGGEYRLSDDQGGHYIGRRFNGPLDDFNHFAQNGNFSMGAYKALENTWDAALKQGASVRVQIKRSYPGKSLRPDALQVQWWIDDVPDEVFFYNRTGGRWL